MAFRPKSLVYVLIHSVDRSPLAKKSGLCATSRCRDVNANDWDWFAQNVLLVSVAFAGKSEEYAASGVKAG